MLQPVNLGIKKMYDMQAMNTGRFEQYLSAISNRIKKMEKQ